MEWTDEGIVIGVRRHGESSAIVELMTREHGRHLGLVRGGMSKRQAPLIQAGNSMRAVWRARLEGGLGLFSLEALSVRTDLMIQVPHAAFGMSHMASLLHLLAERDPHPGLYDVLDAILEAIADAEAAGVLLARFELAMLAELGFGLDLAVCAATGGRNDLVFVSPRTGRAVSESAGAPYAERLLALPTFLIGGPVPPPREDLAAAFALTGHFLAQRIFEPRGERLPEARERFLLALQREAARASRGAG
ncbi:DNA repair protein RecO [Xanthobacter sp. DSM 24535]|uniref:DNA repair protein RecO n=1 Tax=Roseixanthobacter psychrophilus TaxID=3119917 RepID=UPI00372935D1